MSAPKTIPTWAATATAMTVAALVAYAPALAAGFIWDDPAVSENAAVQNWRGILWIWFEPSRYSNFEEHYWPLVYTTFWIEHKLWGLNPAGYHVVNILLHAANAVVLWRLLGRMAVPGALLAAGLFLLHPARVESVAWVIQRKDVLSTLLYLSAFHACVSFESLGGTRRLLAACVLLALALLSKSIVATMPVAAALWFWARPGGWSRRATIGVLTLASVSTVMTVLDYLYMRSHPVDPSGLGALGRVAVAARVPWFYGFKSLWPAGLMTFYPRWEGESPAGWFFIGATALALAGTVLLLFRHRPLAATLLFFAMTLGPVSGLIDFDFMGYSFVADRFQYVAGVGLLLPAAAAMARVDAARGVPGWIGTAFIIMLSAVWGGGTFTQAALYRDQQTLFTEALRRNPDAWPASGGIGLSLLNSGRADEAVPILEDLIRQQPNNVVAVTNLGLAYQKLGDPSRAEQMFRRAIDLMPEYGEALVNLGIVLHEQGRRPEAEHFLGLAQKASPESWKPWYVLAYMRTEEGRFAEASELVGRAIELAPAEPGCRLVDATLHLQSGRMKDAADAARRAIELSPTLAEAHQTLGLAMLGLGEREAARKALEEALRLKPELPLPRKVLDSLNAGG